MTTAVATRRTRLSDDEIISAYSREMEYHERLRDSAAEWARIVCGVDPHAKQRLVLESPLDEPGSEWLIDWARQIGKTSLMSWWLTHRCFSTPGYRAYIVAPSGRHSDVLFNKCASVLTNSEYIDEYVNVKIKDELIRFPDFDSEIRRLKAGTRGDTARGHSTGDGRAGSRGCVVFDECASFLYLNSILNSLDPIALVNGSLIYLGSPGWVGSDFWRLREYIRSEEKRAIEDSREPKHHHIGAHWTDTDHLDVETIVDRKRKMEAMGDKEGFIREYLGRWIQPTNRFWSDDEISSCVVDNIKPLSRSDTIVAGLDIAGEHSCTVALVGRYNPLVNGGRIEVTNYYSLVFEGNRYVNQDDHTVIDNYGQIVDLFLNLRLKYGSFSFLGFDPGNMARIPEELRGLNFPVEEFRTASNPAKVRALRDLSTCMNEGKIVWDHPAITQQMMAFCPPRKPNDPDAYDFPKSGVGQDIIVCLGQLVQYLGTRRHTPFAFTTGEKFDW